MGRGPRAGKEDGKNGEGPKGSSGWVLGGGGRIGWAFSRYRPEGEAQPSSYSTKDKVGLPGSDRPLQVLGKASWKGLRETYFPRTLPMVGSPPPALYRYSCHLQLVLGGPQSTPRTQLDHILPPLAWRRQGKPLAEEAARSRESQLLHWMEPLVRHLAETALSGQQAAYSESPTSWKTYPDSWRSRVGRPLGCPKPPPKRSKHARLGASLRR